MSMGPDGLTHSAEGAGSWHSKAILNYHKKKKKKRSQQLGDVPQT